MHKPATLFLILLLFFCAIPSSSYGEASRRIISLAPNITEILFSLGLGDRIIGVTTFCDYPEEARKKPKVGGMWNPSLEAILNLKPDLVAVSTNGNHKEFEERLRSMGIKTYIFTARRLSELPRDLREAGQAFGAGQRAEVLAQEIEATLSRFKKPAPLRKKRVFFIVWPDPLVAAGPGTLIDDVLNLLGAENVAGKARVSYPKYSIEELLRQAPDIIVIGDMREGIQKMSEGLLKRLKSVPAVKNNKVFYIGDDLYRLGPRTPKGIEDLSRLLGDKP
ncbi:MAG: cobalamin-binding protein [Thermodesulfovibrio sp.]|nr:cobalamin-binding protein [Thermodesulfovibrio sp.]